MCVTRSLDEKQNRCKGYSYMEPVFPYAVCECHGHGHNYECKAEI